MSWLRRRLGWTPIRIPTQRRGDRRAHPVSRQLETQLRRTLQRRWRALLLPVLILCVMPLGMALPASGPPVLKGFMVGTCSGALLMLLIGLVLLMDGSLLRRIGVGVADDVGADLRRTPGVYGVVSNLLFDHSDVDHIVLAPGGVFVIEVKWSMQHAAHLRDVRGLSSHIAQTSRVARKVAGLLRSHLPEVPVIPVLVLSGPGAPTVDEPAIVDGVRVIHLSGREGWARFLGRYEDRLPLATATAAAEVLVALRDRRVAYERDSRRRLKAG